MIIGKQSKDALIGAICFNSNLLRSPPEMDELEDESPIRRFDSSGLFNPNTCITLESNKSETYTETGCQRQRQGNDCHARYSTWTRGASFHPKASIPEVSTSRWKRGFRTQSTFDAWYLPVDRLRKESCWWLRHWACVLCYLRNEPNYVFVFRYRLFDFVNEDLFIRRVLGYVHLLNVRWCHILFLISSPEASFH